MSPYLKPIYIKAEGNQKRERRKEKRKCDSFGLRAPSSVLYLPDFIVTGFQKCFPRILTKQLLWSSQFWWSLRLRKSAISAGVIHGVTEIHRGYPIPWSHRYGIQISICGGTFGGEDMNKCLLSPDRLPPNWLKRQAIWMDNSALHHPFKGFRKCVWGGSGVWTALSVPKTCPSLISVVSCTQLSSTSPVIQTLLS